MREHNIDLNLLNQSDLRLAPVQKVINAQIKKISRAGLALPQRESKPVDESDEEQLWDRKVFGSTDLLSLQEATFFYYCKLFGLRAADEHR